MLPGLFWVALVDLAGVGLGAGGFVDPWVVWEASLPIQIHFISFHLTLFIHEKKPFSN